MVSQLALRECFAVLCFIIGIVFILVLFTNSSTKVYTTRCDDKSCQREEHVVSGEEKQLKLSLLVQLWSNSSYLQHDNEILAHVPRPPHLEDCRQLTTDRRRWDDRSEKGEIPKWTLWRGPLGLEFGDNYPHKDEDHVEEKLLDKVSLVQGPFPPWIEGADEDNLPFTRRVQRDLWLHQHPKNCSDPSVKFLVAAFVSQPGYGVGAQLTGISGAFAFAINENRVLVLDYYNRADHDGCKGSDHSRWTCYFFPETSKECRDRAIELATSEEARKNEVVKDLKSYNGLEFHVTYPDAWGSPWEQTQPTSQVDDKLAIRHNLLRQYWWRAQVIRYLMRFPNEYLCTLLNRARHDAFGMQAAEIVLKTLPKEWPEIPLSHNVTEMERIVWSNHIHKPWIPRPIISVHVRQGDKAGEMKLFPFESYMKLAQDVRDRFPHAENIWLSSEMQDIMEETKNYTGWNFYFTNITRQTGTTSMYEYEKSLGNMTAITNSFVNLFLAADCDYFVGALGSTWDTVIEGLRRTNGKTYAGMLSVNPGMWW